MLYVTKRIKTSSAGPDGLSITYYNKLIPFYLTEITDFINALLNSSEFPAQ